MSINKVTTEMRVAALAGKILVFKEEDFFKSSYQEEGNNNCNGCCYCKFKSNHYSCFCIKGHAVSFNERLQDEIYRVTRDKNYVPCGAKNCEDFKNIFI